MKRFVPVMFFSLILSTFMGRSLVYAQDPATLAAPVLGAHERSMGPINPSGQPVITLVTYQDLNCTHCRDFDSVLKALVDDYSGEVRIVFKHYPITGMREAKILECIDEQKGDAAFWKFVDYVYHATDPRTKGLTRPNPTSKSSYTRWLNQGMRRAGAVPFRIARCTATAAAHTRIDADLAEGRALGIVGTPTTYIYKGGVFQQKVEGYHDEAFFEEIIQTLLQK